MILFAATTYAQSQPSESVSEKQKPDIRENHKAADQHKISSYSSTTTKHPPADITTDRNSTKATADENISINKKIALYTGFLALLAFFQLVAMAVQAHFLSKTLRATKEAADAAQKSSEALPLLERAYVFVQIELGGNKYSSIEGTAISGITVKLVNHGKTPAILTKLHAETTKSAAYPTKLIETYPNEIPPGIVISSGEHSAFPITYETSSRELEQVEQHEIKLICFGKAEYKDVLGVTHETGFCWEYQTRISSFYLSNNKELNYYT
jgi:hypothetical protein